MKKGSVSLSHLGTFPSPGASDYRDNGVLVSQKGWSSERVPRSSVNGNGGSRRHISASSLTPFYSGRTLPSKWEDAERSICSPVLGYGVSKNVNYQRQRRPKSKSGPIVPPGIDFYSNCSPSMNLLDGGESGSVRNLMAGSPFSTGVLMADGVSVHYVGCRAAVSAAAPGGYGVGERYYMLQGDSNGVGPAIMPGWSDLVSEPSLPSSQDEKLDEIKDAGMMINHAVSRRDMATQMSPDESSKHSSPRERSSFGHSPPILPLPTVDNIDHPSKLDIREVQIDKRATITRSLQREEAKISAWENLQRAKAEAAIRKLEMKLEKKRSASMDKILRKLRTSWIKAQEIRNSMSGKEDEQAPKT
ncbi:Detected protein of confused Function [Hibiscus syriacus]|uniref:Detected protein of confused Function n=1 Tax=Hibiscus syriacus TaxID=106335 RepID=A0A6A3AGQ5_HIBSY|nr:Detected protein of confused Function [Hibiscus syriacus]